MKMRGQYGISTIALMMIILPGCGGGGAPTGQPPSLPTIEQGLIGRVVDASDPEKGISGAVVRLLTPAKLEAKYEYRQAMYETSTDNAGYFKFANVTGDYTLRIELPDGSYEAIELAIKIEIGRVESVIVKLVPRAISQQAGRVKIQVTAPAGDGPGGSYLVGKEYQFTAQVLDENDNLTTLTPNWQVEGDIGSISPTGLFRPTKEGNGKIVAFLMVSGKLSLFEVAVHVTAPQKPQTGGVTGVVIDGDTLIPVKGAVVSAGGVSVETNEMGQYIIVNLSPGSYKVIANKNGKSGQIEIMVEAGTITLAKVILLSVIQQPPDSAPPLIKNVTVKPDQLSFRGGQVKISATVKDPSGVKSVKAMVTKPDGSRDSVVMKPAEANTYAGTYIVPPNIRSDGKAVIYIIRVKASDKQNNETQDPGVPYDGVKLQVSGPDPAPSPPWSVGSVNVIVE